MTFVIDDSKMTRLLLFQGVNPVSIRQWLDQCEVEEFSEGTIVLEPSMESDRMFVVLEGAMSIRLNAAENPPVAHAYEGESVGEMSVFDGQNPSAFVKAESDVRLLVIRRQLLLNMIDNSNGIARNLLYLLSNRIRSGNAAVTDSQLLQKEYEQHANVDVLTSLHNRRWLNAYFKRLLTRIEQESREAFPLLTVMMVDVDHFKKFNDAYGHLSGDKSLRFLADALRESVRPTDMIARYGGEEFLIVLPETSQTDSDVVAERVRKGVEQAAIKLEDKNYPGLTISLGVAQLQKCDSFSDIIDAADQALYRAKNDGRNRISFSARQ